MNSWKIIAAGASLASGVVANKLVDAVWKVAFHKDRPDEEDLTEPIRDVVVFAIVSAAVSAVLNQVFLRRTAKWYGLEAKREQD